MTQPSEDITRKLGAKLKLDTNTKDKGTPKLALPAKGTDLLTSADDLLKLTAHNELTVKADPEQSERKIFFSV